MRDSYERRVAFWVTKLCKAMEAIRQHELEQVGLYRGQAAILWQLRQRDGITQTNLAGRLDLTRASITSSLVRMEDTGWIRRDKDPADRRVLRVFLTPDGKRLARKLDKVLENIEAALTNGLEAESIACLIDTLRETHTRLAEQHADRARHNAERKG